MVKKILIVSQYFYPEQFRVNDIAASLVKKGYEVTVLTGLPNYPKGSFFKGFNWFNLKKETQYEGVKIIRLPIWPRGKNKFSLILNYLSFLWLGNIWAILTNKKFDLVFTYGISPILQGEIANTYAKRHHVPSFLYLMDFWPYSIEAVDGIKNKSLLKFIKDWSLKIYKKSNKILISSEGYRQDLIDLGINDSKIHYWPQYSEDFYQVEKEDNTRTPDLIKEKGFFYFGFTGNFGKAQGILAFIDFIHKIKNELLLRKVKFVLIGDGIEKAKISSLIEKNNLKSIIQLIPPKTASEIPYYLAKMDAALVLIKQHLHLTKVIPAKLQTYVACEKPVWLVGNGYLAKFIEENQIGFATQSYEAYKILEGLDLFINNYQDLRISSKRTLFNKDILLNNLIKLFNSVE
jgi:glycosyltransferase involved in cell wall biosynthesis